jgi:hypothetical protein
MKIQFIAKYFFILSLAYNIKASYNYCQAPGIVPSIDTDGLNLSFVQVVTRHGDRTPTKVLPYLSNDKAVWECNLNWLTMPGYKKDQTVPEPPRLYRTLYINNSELLHPGNCAIGQLTEKGLNQTIELGKELRALYVDQYGFLPPSFDPNLIYIRSTNVPRTIQSAQGQFYGMYPPVKEDDVQVISIHTMDIDLEDMYGNDKICPRLTSVYDDVTHQKDYLAYLEKYHSFHKKLQAIFNTTKNLDYQELSDALFARQCHNMPFPHGITSDTLETLLKISNFEQSYLYANPLAGRLTIGLFVKNIVSAIDAFIEGKSEPIYILYSGHDATLAPLLSVFGVYDKEWPPYASNLQIELWRNNSAVFPYTANDYFVEMKYNGGYMKPTGCSGVMCNYGQEWRPLAVSTIPKNGECGKSKPTRNSFNIF